MFLCAVIIGFASMTAMRFDTMPEFKFENETYDFGKIPQGKPVSTDFKFTNTGDQPLIISNVEPTCGCTVASFTKTPILKGQSGVVTLTFNAAVAAPFTKGVQVKSNAKTPIKVLYLKGEVIASTSK